MSNQQNGDESKVSEWLLDYFESWHGPKETWKKRTRDEFFQDTATLTLFCKNFRFKKEKP